MINSRSAIKANAIGKFLRKDNGEENTPNKDSVPPMSPSSLTSSNKELKELSDSVSLPSIQGAEEVLTMSMRDFLGEEEEKKPEKVGDTKKGESEDIARELINNAFIGDEYKEYKEQLEAIHASFLMLKECMNIPSKEVRRKLATAAIPNVAEAIQIRLIMQDKAVLHHVQYVDDIAELVGIVKKIKKAPEKEKEELRILFEDKIKFIINDMHPKEEYVKAKLQNEGMDLSKIQEAFDTYCRENSYCISTEIPKIFACDRKLEKLNEEKDKLHSNQRDKLHRYFGNNGLTTVGRNQPTTHLNYETKQSFSETAKNFVAAVKRKQELFEQTVARCKKLRTATNTVNIEGIKLFNDPGQDVLAGDTQLKDLLKKIRGRIKELKKVRKDCKAEKVKLEKLHPEIKALLDQIPGLPNLLKGSRKLLSEYNKAQQDKPKDLEDFYKLMKDNFVTEVEKLNKVKENLEQLKKDKEELELGKEEQNRLMQEIPQLKNELKLSKSCSLNIDEISNDLQEFIKKIAALPNKFSDKDLDTLLKEHADALIKQKAEIAELKQMRQKLLNYGKTRDALKDKLLTEQQIEDRYKHIKEQARQYWGQAMRVQFETNATAAEDIVRHLLDYHPDMQKELDEAEHKSHLGKLLTDLGDVIRDSMENVLFNVWCAEQKIETSEAARTRFRSELAKIGFDNVKYKELVDNARKLLMIRDCLLENKKLNKNATLGLRDAFKSAYGLAGREEKDVDIAIEVYYIKQLKKLTDDSFEKIYDLREADIKNAQNENSVKKCLLKFFKGAEKYSEQRQICSVQMQIGFLEGMANYLDNMKNIPSVKARRFIRGTITAFVCTAIGLGIALAVGGLSFGVVPLVLIGCCIVGAIVTKMVGRHSWFKYQRRSSDRKSLELTSVKIKSEAKRLKSVAEDLVETNLNHLVALEKLENINKLNIVKAFKKAAKFLKTGSLPKNEKFLIGALDALIREYYDRYRHSPFMEVDYKKALAPLLKRSGKQTLDLQQALLAYLTDPRNNQDSLTLLIEYLTGTQKLLTADKDSPHSDERALANFRKILASLFNIEEKIKEQILEIVSAIPIGTGDLPEQLIRFYCDVLHGSADDLNRVRRLHSLEAIKDAAGAVENAAEDSLRRKMESQSYEKPIFAGSDSYRVKMGGWGIAKNGLMHRDAPKDSTIEPITLATLKKYLNNSLAFLLSLDAKSVGFSPPDSLDKECVHTDQYLIYRAMFLKQLAEMVDYADSKFQPLLKEAILEFAKDKLSIKDPKKFFSEIQHQDRLVEADNRQAPPPVAAAALASQIVDHSEDKGLDEKHVDEVNDVNLNKTYNSSIVDTIRVSITYDTQKVTAQDLMKQYVPAAFLRDNKEVFVLDPKLIGNLGTPTTVKLLENMETAISNTEKLFREILAQPVLVDFQVHQIYLKTAMKQLAQLKTDIDTKLNGQPKPNKQESDSLLAAQEALQRHMIKLQLMCDLQVAAPNANAPVQEKQNGNNNSPKLHFVSRTPPGRTHVVGLFRSGEVVCGPMEGADEAVVKRDLLKALSTHPADKDRPVQFNLACLRGDEKWKEPCRQLLNPFLTEQDKHLFTDVPLQRQPRAALFGQ